MAYAVNFSAGNWGGLIDDLEDVIAIADTQTDDDTFRSTTSSTYAECHKISVTNDSDKILKVNFFATWSASVDGDIAKFRWNVNGNAGREWFGTQSSNPGTGVARQTESMFALTGATGTFDIEVQFARADGSGTISVVDSYFCVLHMPYRGNA